MKLSCNKRLLLQLSHSELQRVASLIGMVSINLKDHVFIYFNYVLFFLFVLISDRTKTVGLCSAFEFPKLLVNGLCS